MKQTELRRTGFARKMPSAEPKKQLPRCAICKQRFEPLGKFQAKACGPDCAIELVARDKARIAAAKARKERAEDKKKLVALRSKADWTSLAQIAFNAYIRFRDRDQPCICCGKPFEPQKPGGSMDAGHYLSRGASPHLRFVENNVFGQRKNCNMPGGAKRNEFRAGVIARIGLEAVEALEADNTPRKYSIDDLKAIEAHYKARLKELKGKL